MSTAIKIPAEVRERVRRGAKVLDRARPGWARHVRPRRLDLGTCSRCTMGQLYGDYDDGLDELCPARDFHGAYEWAERHGFRCLESEETDDTEPYRILTAAWRLEIVARQSSPAAQGAGGDGMTTPVLTNDEITARIEAARAMVRTLYAVGRTPDGADYDAIGMPATTRREGEAGRRARRERRARERGRQRGVGMGVTA